MDTFTDIYLLDLHGNSNKRERAPDGGIDENVFDIRQGVSIAIFVKEAGKRKPATVHHADLWGDRQTKYSVLEESDVSTTDWKTLEPASPNYLFKPWDNAYQEEYEGWSYVTSIFSSYATGFQTHRDKTAIAFDESSLIHQVESYLGRDPDSTEWEQYSCSVDYRPLDRRYGYLSTEVSDRPRMSVMKHMLKNNIGLNLVRQTKLDYWSHSFVSRYPTPAVFVEIKDGSSMFPLYLYPSEQEIAQGLYSHGERQSNLAPEFISDLERRLGMRFVGDGKGDLRDTFGPEDVLHYIYAVLHSPTYRERYDQFLRADFPRVPISNDSDLFRELATLGKRLTEAHLMDSTTPGSSPIGFPVAGDNLIEKAHPKYYAPGERPPGVKSPLDAGRVYISKDNRRSGKRGQYFDGIAQDVWEFRIGGYQPMDKWLKDRRGRTLTFDDLDHYQRIAAALEETIGLMEKVDDLAGRMMTSAPTGS